MDNLPLLRLAHSTLLGLKYKSEREAAITLDKHIIAESTMVNICVRFLLDDIALLKVVCSDFRSHS